ncbi:class I SAM-dependent methyltransferase [Ancylobacter sp. Lp-2]|uniref:class I SAM-dependent methyltransferase n=1 Tax=Ancylobacter sp. Lp-2 TaxID=2881339 RepID=UPI001E5C3592|nr:class I SAM-dependent methyltransferase [Ancylobacter sp. Lp-2]MCB4768354.1 class I SAM-dependent methyltransferase [Ancylobacter sp. Lp-2]
MKMNFSCPICGGETFVDFRGRIMEECKKCKSKARERAEVLTLKSLGYFESKKKKVLHINPERATAKLLSKTYGKGYQAKTIGASVDFVDSVSYPDLEALLEAATEKYDVILHNNLLEVVSLRPFEVISKLDGLLKPNGIHLFTVTVRGMRTDEGGDLMLDEAERAKRFGRADRYRLFGAADFPRALATLRQQNNPRFNFAARFSDADLDRWRIPPSEFRDINSNTVFSYVAPPAVAVAVAEADVAA